MSCGSDLSSAAFSIVPPIHHLPTELLVHVFHHLRETVVNRCSNPEDCQWTYETTSTDWAIVMLVCRYWCDVAYATPGLWRTIWIKDKHEIRRLPVALQRSHDTLIDVTLGAKVTTSAVVETLLPHASRLHSLSLVNEPYLSSLKLLGPLWTVPMPALRELLINQATPSPVWWFDVLELDDNFLPALRTLRVSEAIFPWHSPIVPKLHTLRVHRVDHNGTVQTPGNFVAFLQSCATGAMRHLELQHAYIYDLTVFQENSPDTHRRVDLPYLESLSLTYHTTTLFKIVLSHATLSPSADLNIVWDLTLEDGVSLAIEEASHGLLDIVPHDPRCIPHLSTTVAAVVTVKDRRGEKHIRLVCETSSTEGSPAGKMEVTLWVKTLSPTLEWAYTVDQLMEDFCILFADSPLHELSLTFADDEPLKRRLSEASSSRIHRTFPTLSRLDVV